MNVGIFATALMMSAVTSCYKLGGDTEVISEDDPWFNFSSIEIEAGDDPAEYEYIMSDFIAQFENYYVYETMGLRKLPEDVDFNNLDYMDYLVERIDFFNLDGSLNYSLNLSDYIVENDLGDYAYLNSVYKIDNYLRVDISAIDIGAYCFCFISSAFRFSASTYIDRNLYILNFFPFLPTRI